MRKERISSLATQIRGVSYKPSDLHKSLDDGSIIVLRANNIDEGKINFDDVVYVDRGRVSPSQILKRGDVLICASSGSKSLVGKAAQVDFDKECSFGAFCKVVRSKPSFSDYLGLFFQSPRYRREISELAQGANINNIRNEDVDNLELPCYDAKVQAFIVRTLRLVSEIIKKRQKQLRALDELVKARFIEMFGDVHNSKKYPYKAVQTFTKVTSGGTPNRNTPEYWENGTIPWVKTTELQNNILCRTEEYITEKGLNESSAKIVPADTILIAMYGQGKTRGMTAYLQNEAATNQACACIYPSIEVDQKYLWCYFILSYEKLRSMAEGGNQPNLNGNMIKSFPVLLPPKYLQTLFVSFLDQTNHLKSKLRESLTQTETLFNSLMQQYFG